MSAALLWLLLAADPEIGKLWIRDGGTKPPLALPGVGFVWELPPTTREEIPIDGTTFVDGIPVRLRQLVVKGSPGEIGGHFLESFKRQGLYVGPKQRFDRMLTGVDPQSIVTYSVVLQANGPDHTTVILGESRPLDRKKPVDGLPVLPQAKGALPVQFEGYALLSYLAPVTEPEARGFYERELLARGYKLGEGGAWVKPGERVEVAVTPQGGQMKVTVKQHRAP